ncbi:sulfotransferase domain-containing protein [Ruegeria sp. HKCCD8929]|uniref:sulfotransferase domain-containing protein n=1 Tax=Ruegeria sp. HKCCD8929 TaxID=2683006 RepID=UPI001488C50D|nr:sulfotransferase domain-containing protein [Ruegeria sp. HKCCD8929]
MSSDIVPMKTREFQNHHFDSTIWNDFSFRGDDIIISSYAKSGTTWTQQICAQLVFGANNDKKVAEISPWVDLRVPPKEVKLPAIEAQDHRRIMKTHLPIDALVFSKKAKYIYIGRDGRDVVFSFFHHHTHANETWYHAMNDTPSRVGPPIEPPTGDVVQYFNDWLDKDGYPMWPFWESIRGWWNVRNLPNVLFLHFEAMKRDMAKEIRRVAAFIGTEINEDEWDDILHHCSFEYMKENAADAAPLGGIFWDGGAQTFVNKGVNGRWRDVLSAEDVAKYESVVSQELPADCAHWLATGEMR